MGRHRKPFVKMCMFSCGFFNLVYLQDSAQLSDAIDWFLSKSNNKLRGTLLLAEVSSYLLGTKDGVYFEGVRVRDFQFASSGVHSRHFISHSWANDNIRSMSRSYRERPCLLTSDLVPCSSSYLVVSASFETSESLNPDYELQHSIHRSLRHAHS